MPSLSRLYRARTLLSVNQASRSRAASTYPSQPGFFAEACQISNTKRPILLQDQALLVKSVKQRIASYDNSLAFSIPKLLTEHQELSWSTNSWDLPALAVKNAKLYFDQYRQVSSFHYGFNLVPSDEAARDVHRFEFIFHRTRSGIFEVRQKMTWRIEKIGDPHSWVESSVNAIWQSPEGNIDLTNKHLDLIANQVSESAVNPFKPLNNAIYATLDTLVGSQATQQADLSNPCLDVLENYKAQKQPWALLSIECCVIDGPFSKYRVHFPDHHLGRIPQQSSRTHRAIIAFGSNIGDRRKHIEESLLAMGRRQMTLRSTSFLYETKAMYYEEQEPFLNGVCEVETSLEPLALLDTLQEIENELGRVRLVDKGPRTVDLDILLYDFESVDHPRLQIPHKLMTERDFVLRPLADIIPEERLPPPQKKLSVLAYLESVSLDTTRPQPFAVASLGSRLPMIHPNDLARRTRVMAILNVTPDSFSDGGRHDLTNLASTESVVRRFITNGAAIIDVGGQSTRPGAAAVSRQEELDRVRPVIERIRSMPEARDVAISVDTFYADVARGAVEAGADIINDVSGGMLDPKLLPLAAERQTTVILMHMRGTPETMTTLTNYPDGVVEGVAKELLERIREAQAAGVPRWRIVLDPGIGFAKTQAQNLELLCNLDTLRRYPGLDNFPWLVGTSRKGFIGKITGVSTPQERAWGTAATVTASVAGGADIVRVHDVAEMSQVTRMADAMYRSAPI